MWSFIIKSLNIAVAFESMQKNNNKCTHPLSWVSISMWLSPLPIQSQFIATPPSKPWQCRLEIWLATAPDCGPFKASRNLNAFILRLLLNSETLGSFDITLMSCAFTNEIHWKSESTHCLRWWINPEGNRCLFYGFLKSFFYFFCKLINMKQKSFLYLLFHRIKKEG